MVLLVLSSLRELVMGPGTLKDAGIPSMSLKCKKSQLDDLRITS